MELKPCPFCGSKEVEIWHDCIAGGVIVKAYCVCNDCGTGGPTTETAEEAAAQWNSRDGAARVKDYKDYFELTVLLDELEGIEQWIYNTNTDKIIHDPNYRVWDEIGFCRMMVYLKIKSIEARLKTEMPPAPEGE